MGQQGKKDESPSGAERRKVAVVPFAVLLPSLGDVSMIMSHAEQFLRRLEELQDARDRGDEVPDDELRRVAAEEAMLVQLQQWLAVDQTRGLSRGDTES